MRQNAKYLTSLRKFAFAASAVLILSNCTGLTMSPEQSSKAVEISASEHSCLTEAIYFEAGSTNDEGRRAVGEVILNRAADPRFPRSICGVVDQRYNGSCQFSYRCDSISEEFRSAEVKAASAHMATILLADRGEDITHGALFFRAAWAGSSWFDTLDPRGQFGGNVFYR